MSIANGSNDEQMERGDGSGGLPEDGILRQWGHRWLRVFRRKAAVEEAFIAEAMAGATPVQPAASAGAPVQDANDGDLDVADADAAGQ